jgi:peptidoglycan hydrolase-like protein with peptidoglycan-binding domain
MGCSNFQQEIGAEDEDAILREFFPELLEASELNEDMERGGARYGSGGGGRTMMSASYTRRPAMAGQAGRRNSLRKRRWPMGGYGYGSSYDSGTTAGAAPQQDWSWAQSCLAQILGPWVRQSGRWDSITKRAIRIFQSRSRLQVTGWLDRRTRAALRQACGQQSGPDPGADAAPAPAAAPVDAGPPDAVSSASDDAPDQGQPSPQDGAPPDAGPQQEWVGETSLAPTSGCNEDRCTREYVSWVQRSLNQLGSKLIINGLLDRNTINAITQFKRKNGVSGREYYASPVLERALVQAGATSPPTPRRLPCGVTDLKVLLPLLQKYRNDIPLEYLLGWVTVESGGKLGDLTKICERGYFQVHPEESQGFRPNLDHDRLSTDPDYSVKGGVQLVNYYRNGVVLLADQLGIDKNSDLFWGLVKLRHWIPSAPQRLLARMSQEKIPISSWESIRQYVTANPALRLGGFDPRDGVKSVDKYLAVAARWRKRLAGG